MIKLTEEMREHINNALMNRAPLIIASVDEEGQPHLTFRGSTHVHGDDMLAIWARNPDGAFLRHIASNPRVALMYQNFEARVGWQFQGRAHVTTDPAEAKRVYDESPEPERNLDPERKGCAVVIVLDRVIQRGTVIMER